MSWRKLGIVARFELAEALRSRLIVVVLAVYGAGAGFGAFAFAKAVNAAERAVQSQLEDSLIAHDLSAEELRRQALPQLLARVVDDPALRDELVRIDPLALFYGFMALQLVAPLVLILSGGAHATDLGRGATRFVLTRCDRLSWALGKLLGHAALLALGLLVGALVTAVVAGAQSQLELGSVFWLLRAALRAFAYGLAYLGIFVGLGLGVRVPARTRALSVLALIGLSLGHSLCRAEWFEARLPFASALAWCFPSEYEWRLWSPNLLLSGAAMLALLGIGAVGFAIGHALFRRSDA